MVARELDVCAVALKNPAKSKGSFPYAYSVAAMPSVLHEAIKSIAIHKASLV